MDGCLFSGKVKSFLILLAVLMAFSGCTGPQTADVKESPAEVREDPDQNSLTVPKSKDITIAMVPKSLDNPVFLDAKEAGERTGRELGVKIEWLGSMQTDSSEQEAIVESLIRRQVDGIVISCIDPERMRPVINKAVEAGIKVATFDSDSPNSNRLFYCGTNNYDAGEACGRALIQVLKSKNKDQETLNLLIMTADEGSYNLNERLRSFMDTARKGGIKLQVIDTLYCKDDINLAGDLLEEYIRKEYINKGQKADVFFSTGGWPLIVPYESMPAFQAWCKAGGTSIVIDTFYPIVDAARKGMADALVGQDFKKMGELSIRNIYKAIKGESIPLKFIDTGLELGDKSNYDILLQSKKRWEIK